MWYFFATIPTVWYFLELFRQCGIFLELFRQCGIVFGTVSTVWYFFGTVSTVWYLFHFSFYSYLKQSNNDVISKRGKFLFIFLSKNTHRKYDIHFNIYNNFLYDNLIFFCLGYILRDQVK